MSNVGQGTRGDIPQYQYCSWGDIAGYDIRALYGTVRANFTIDRNRRARITVMAGAAAAAGAAEAATHGESEGGRDGDGLCGGLIGGRREAAGRQ